MDDGDSAAPPDEGDGVFDEVSRCWTRAVPGLLGRIKVLEEELRKAKAVAVVEPGFPSRALTVGAQRIGLFVLGSHAE